MTTILNKIGAMRLTPARFFGFWLYYLPSCSLSRPALTTSMCNSLTPSRWR